ncbi:MAG: SGNH/GDSL hydrolase family protein [Gammaproteobacteria bacterium]|nr:SGNH/GDSL hydrolase family protein [Gammaproteobacteria bacterium]
MNRLPEEVVQVEYNANGWRDVLHPDWVAEDKQRVVVLGDSFIEGYSVRLNDTLTSRLQALLSDEVSQVEVTNLGVGGYGTLQEYLVFDAVGRALQPDVVVLAMFLDNDLRNNTRSLEALITRDSLKYDARPFLQQGDDGEWSISVVDIAAAWRRYLLSLETRRSLWGRMKRESALLQLIDNAVHGPGASRRKIDALDRYLALYGAQFCNAPPEYEEAWGVTRRILRRLRDEVDAAGARLVVMIVPAVHSVDRDAMARVQDNAPDPDRLCLEQSPAGHRLMRELDAIEVPLLDLLPAFRAAAWDRGVELFRRSDDHWNPAGHALAAAELAKFIRERGLLVPDLEREVAPTLTP